MGEPRQLRVVHLSDLHACHEEGEKKAAQTRVVAALIADIESIREEREVDAIVFSGDLAFDGSPEALQRGREILLDALRERFPDAPIIIAPGNHDVERDRIDPVEEAGLRAVLTDRDKVQSRLSDSDMATQARVRLSSWDAMASTWDAKLDPVPISPYGSEYRMKCRDLEVAFGVFDTAWRSEGGEGDRGKLILGVDSLAAFLKGVGDADLSIVVFHHPLDWLAEFDSKPLSNALEGARALVLTGHDHSADPSLVITTRGSALYCKAPCSYDGPAYENGYAIIDIDVDSQTTTILLRRWLPKREVFGPDVETAEDGQKEFPWPVSPNEIVPVVQLSDSKVLEPLAVTAQENSVLGDHIDDMTPHTVSDFAVAPRFWPVPHTEVFDRSSDREHRPSEADAIETLDEHNVVTLSGPRMSGVTTATLWILEMHFRRKGTHVPAYVKSDPRFSLGRIQGAISAARDRIGTAVLPVVIAIDDVAPADKRALGRLIRLVKENPDVLFLFGCHDEAHETISRALEERLSISPGKLFLGPFGRRETRALVSRIAGSDGGELVRKVLDVVQRQKLPRNPLNLAALVSVIAREPTLTAVNESGLLQSYVGVLLDNPLALDPEGLNMDYRRREHLLQRIAQYVVEGDISRIPRLNMEKLVIEYFESIGIESKSAGQQVDSLIYRRILVEDDSGVGFRYPALLYLFAAKAASEDPEFRAKVFSNTRLYAPIIRHIAGLKRNDVDTLQRVLDELQRTRIENAEGVLVSQFDLIEDKDGWSKIETLEQARSLVANRPEPPSEEELDEIYDEAIEDPDESVEVSPFADEDSDRIIDRLAPAFGLAAAVLQSSELITDTDLRREALREVIEGWSIITVLTAVEEDMFKGFREMLEPIFAEIADAEKRASMAEHFARLFIVNVMVVGLYVETGSIHHQKMLKELLDDDDFMSDSANALFGTMLYAMLYFPKWPDRLKELVDRHGSHPMVFETVRMWSHEEFQSEKLPRKDEDPVVDLLVAMLLPQGPSGPGSVPARARQAAEIRKTLFEGRFKARRTPDDDDVIDVDSIEIDSSGESDPD
jgi:metallophosphoesterase superfamily enzyme